MLQFIIFPTSKLDGVNLIRKKKVLRDTLSQSLEICKSQLRYHPQGRIFSLFVRIVDLDDELGDWGSVK
jgi:hypothetical protein